MQLNETQQVILETWFDKQEEILTEKIAPKNLRSWCIILIMITGERDVKKLNKFINETYRDEMDLDNPGLIKVSKNAMRQLLVRINRVAIGNVRTKNYLYESLTTRITDVDYSTDISGIRNKHALKFLIGVLFRANIASWMVERYLEIMVKLALPFNIWYLETMIVYLRMGIKYYSENLIEKIEMFKVGEKMVITELCKIEDKLLGNIPKNIYGENIQEMENSLENNLEEEYASSDEEYVEFTFPNKEKTGYWTLRILGSKEKKGE